MMREVRLGEAQVASAVEDVGSKDRPGADWGRRNFPLSVASISTRRCPLTFMGRWSSPTLRPRAH